MTYFLNTYNYLFFFTGQHGVKMAEVKCSNKETVISAEFHPMDPGLIVTCGKGHVNFWHLGLVFSIKLTDPLTQISQLPGRVFSPSDIWKKLSQPLLLHFPFGMGTYVHHTKYY